MYRSIRTASGSSLAILFISERSRLPVVLPIRDAERLRTVFPEAVCERLVNVGVSAADIADRFINAYRWSGAGADNNWSTAANWTGGAVPTPPRDRG